MKNLKKFNENNVLTYCKNCSFLLYPDDGDILCKYCLVLDILGVRKTDDVNNIYGQLKYMIKFNKSKLIPYLNDIKLEYKLTDEQFDKIKEILL